MIITKRIHNDYYKEHALKVNEYYCALELNFISNLIIAIVAVFYMWTVFATFAIKVIGVLDSF